MIITGCIKNLTQSQIYFKTPTSLYTAFIRHKNLQKLVKRLL